jgi:exodeoxyribonuclease VII small subunit
MDSEKKPSFEEALVRLEEVVSEMENRGTTLDRSIELYKEGVAISKLCKDTLTSAEKEITVLQQSMDGIFSQTSLDPAKA